MAGLNHGFFWSIPTAGYRWADLPVRSTGGQPARVLVEHGEPGIGPRRRYDLGEQPALFRQLAAIPPTETGILEFANQWGALGEADLVVGDPVMAGQPAELFPAWVRSISEMKQAVWVWNRLTSKTPAEQRELLRRFKWESDDQGRTSVKFDSHPHLPPRRASGDDGYMRVASVIASDHFSADGLSQYQWGEVSQPARTFLGNLVNEALRRRVSLQVVPDEEPVGSGLPVLFSLRDVPSNLYAALWLALARVMTSDKEQRQCPGCGAWFEVKAKGELDGRGVRADKKYCRPACRLRAYRHKQDHARRLYAEGKSFKEVAMELGTPVQQIKKWVTTKKKG